MTDETDMKCQWSNLYDQVDEGVAPEHCGNPAQYTTCDPVGGVVCGKHKCRCSKPLFIFVCPLCSTAEAWSTHDATSVLMAAKHLRAVHSDIDPQPILHAYGESIGVLVSAISLGDRNGKDF